MNVIVHEPETTVDGVEQERAAKNKGQCHHHRDSRVFDQGLSFSAVFHRVLFRTCLVQVYLTNLRSSTALSFLLLPARVEFQELPLFGRALFL